MAAAGSSTIFWFIVLGYFITVLGFGGYFARFNRNTSDFFFGGGVETYWHLGQMLSVHAYYSYLDNENRPSIRIDQDLRGEHMFYVGMIARFGGRRR